MVHMIIALEMANNFKVRMIIALVPANNFKVHMIIAIICLAILNIVTKVLNFMVFGFTIEIACLILLISIHF